MDPDYYLVSAAMRAHRLRIDRTYVFGREEGVDIPLQDALVSRRHAEMRWVDEGFWEVRDLGSRNGVFVDSSRIPGPTRLGDGSQLQIGGQVFKMHLLPPGADPLSLGLVAPDLAGIETRGHEQKAQDQAGRGATFSGAVSGGGITELLQFLKSGKKRGRLDFVGGATLASVWVLDGDPVHATFDEHVGVNALIMLERTPPPRFTFYANAAIPPDRSLEGTVHGILMEVARRMDEKQG